MEKTLFNSAARQYQDMVYRVALHIFGNRQDAEDAVQEVFLRLYTCEKPFEGTDHLRHWLIRVTVNVCKDALKSPWRRRRCSTGRSRGSCTGRSWPFRRNTARCCTSSTTRN